MGGCRKAENGKVWDKTRFLLFKLEKSILKQFKSFSLINQMKKYE